MPRNWAPQVWAAERWNQPAESGSIFDDSFSGASLDPKWSIFDTAIETSTVSGGELHTTHVDGLGVGEALWYDGFDGYLIYQEITGDFDAVATVRVSNGTDTGALAVTNYRVGALQAHDPDRTSVRNYLSVGIGAIAEATLRAEWKTTVDNASDTGVVATGDFDSIPWASGAGQIRLNRVSDTYNMYVRLTSGDAWTLLQSVTRADMPAALQVGLCFYSNQPTPDGMLHVANFQVTV